MTTELVLHGRIYRVVHAALPLIRCGTFRPLSDSEEQTFRNWARGQEPGTEINPAWHPAVQDELLITGLGQE